MIANFEFGKKLYKCQLTAKTPTELYPYFLVIAVHTIFESFQKQQSSKVKGVQRRCTF